MWCMNRTELSHAMLAQKGEHQTLMAAVLDSIPTADIILFLTFSASFL